MIGQTISHFRILQKLGSGGMGEVFLAEDTKLDRKVALKFLPGILWNESEARERLIREAKAASKLDHPNVVTIFGIEEHEGRPFISMAHVPGVTLNQYCTSQKRSTSELIDLAIQIADGLQHAHEAGVVHRDLKPSNILVDERGRARILDFGIASLRGAAKLTQTGSTVGTLAYAPPELAQGRPAEPVSDIYSLGVVLYQMLSGRLPFEADHEAALLYSILHEHPKPLSDVKSDLSPTLTKVVEKCLLKAPELRYQSSAELVAALKAARPKEVSSAPAAADRPSIAVLPFNNMSADPENEFFSDGLTEELLNALAKNPGLRVTGRTSSFAFKGKHEDLRDIGQKLGVETLLEGSVRKAGQRVRITAQLVKVADGFHLWSETYDRVLDDIFAVQDDIASSVSKAMDVALLGKWATRPPRNPATYSLVLQARHMTARNTREALERAVELFQQVLSVDPQDASAWAGLARATMVQASYGHTKGTHQDELLKVRHAIDKALELDPNQPDAWEVLGWLKVIDDLDYAGSEAAFRKAYELAPGDSRMVTGMATFLHCIGRLDDARRLSEEATRIDPLNPEAFQMLGRGLFLAGDFAGAQAAYEKALQLSPGMSTVHYMLGGVLHAQGRSQEGLLHVEMEPQAGYRNCGKAILLHDMGRAKESDEALAALLSEGEQWCVQFAMAHSKRGERDLAFAALERAYELRDSGLPLTRVSLYFQPLHSDPRWPVFLRKIGFKD